MLTRLKKLFMKIPASQGMKVYIFFLMLVMGILPSFIMRVGILQAMKNVEGEPAYLGYADAVQDHCQPSSNNNYLRRIPQ